MIPDILKKRKFSWPEWYLRHSQASIMNIFAKLKAFSHLLFSQNIFFIDVWLVFKYASGDSFVHEIMQAIDDFSSSSWFEWKNHEN